MEPRVDVVVVGAGTSGLNVARDLAVAGASVTVLEAGSRYDKHTYPRNELDGSAQLYWGGGVELNHDASIGILRPRVVGGGSIVNQALMDRFDEVALGDWRERSGVEFFDEAALDPWYTQAESYLSLTHVPEEARNRNAEIFAEGFARNGYRHARLRRAQTDCKYDDGNSCVECLSGCRIDSKQSTAITALPRAEAHGATLVADIEINHIDERSDGVIVTGHTRDGHTRQWQADRVVLAAGAIGNSALLLASGYGKRYPALGTMFFTHPQYMNFGVFSDPVHAEVGPLQNYKSDDPGFRRQGFKLENVYAGPASLAMLMPGYGREHLRKMRNISHYGCIEVCVRDTNPGTISVGRKGTITVKKSLNAEDIRRREAGMAAIRNIFHAMGAREVIRGQIGIGLHLMGGLGMGADPERSVVGPDFALHGSSRLYAADSSIFPDAPGINPGLTIAALSIKAAAGLAGTGKAVA